LGIEDRKEQGTLKEGMEQLAWAFGFEDEDMDYQEQDGDEAEVEEHRMLEDIAEQQQHSLMGGS